MSHTQGGRDKNYKACFANTGVCLCPTLQKITAIKLTKTISIITRLLLQLFLLIQMTHDTTPQRFG
jgi:hypothetical protein